MFVSARMNEFMVIKDGMKEGMKEGMTVTRIQHHPGADKMCHTVE